MKGGSLFPAAMRGTKRGARADAEEAIAADPALSARYVEKRATMDTSESSRPKKVYREGAARSSELFASLAWEDAPEVRMRKAVISERSPASFNRGAGRPVRIDALTKWSLKVTRDGSSTKAAKDAGEETDPICHIIDHLCRISFILSCSIKTSPSKLERSRDAGGSVREMEDEWWEGEEPTAVERVPTASVDRRNHGLKEVVEAAAVLVSVVREDDAGPVVDAPLLLLLVVVMVVVVVLLLLLLRVAILEAGTVSGKGWDAAAEEMEEGTFMAEALTATDALPPFVAEEEEDEEEDEAAVPPFALREPASTATLLFHCERSRKRREASAILGRHSAATSCTMASPSPAARWKAGKMYWGKMAASEEGKEVMRSKMAVREAMEWARTVGATSASCVMRNGTSLCSLHSSSA
jgi:hypothetical protein